MSDSTDNTSELDIAQLSRDYAENTAGSKDDDDAESQKSDISCICLDDTISSQKELESASAQAKSVSRVLSKKSKMKRSISESVERNNNNKTVRALTICLGARVLALKDKAKHKWKEATIVRITESGQKISSPIKDHPNNIQNKSKLIKAAYYTVKFDSDAEDDDLDAEIDQQIPLFADDNYSESRVYGEIDDEPDSSSNNSDNYDDSSRDDSLDEKSSSSRNLTSNTEDQSNKKRKVARKTSSSNLKGKSSGRCKKRTTGNSKSNSGLHRKISLDSFKNSNLYKYIKYYISRLFSKQTFSEEKVLFSLKKPADVNLFRIDF